MSAMRDEQLGRALSALDVPEHQEGFWEELAARLRAEAGAGDPTATGAPANGELEPALPARVRSLAGRRRPAATTLRRVDPRWLVSGAVAAVVALVVAAAVVLSDGAAPSTVVPVATTPTDPTTPTEPTEPTTPTEPTPTVPITSPSSVTGAVTVTLDDGSERRFSFVADRDGSRLVRDVDSGEVVARDVAGGQDVVVPPTDAEGATALRRRGLPAAGPSTGFADAISDPSIVSHVLSLVATGDPAVTEVEVLGRAAWRVETDLVPNDIGGGPDHSVAVVDQATGLLLSLEEEVDGERFRTIEVTTLEASDRPAAPGAFEVDGDAEVFDEGFTRIGIDELRGAVGDAAVLPAAVPEGFVLTTIDVQPGAGEGSGPEGMNPVSVDTTVLVYRRGWEELVVTTRRTGGVPSAWDDPFRGEGQVQAPVTATIQGGELDGTAVEIVIDPTTTTHLWGVGEELVVTVSSTAVLHPDTLVEVAGSLEPLP